MRCLLRFVMFILCWHDNPNIAMCGSDLPCYLLRVSTDSPTDCDGDAQQSPR